MSGSSYTQRLPLTLSLSKGVSGSSYTQCYPLKWFDRLTMSGKEPALQPANEPGPPNIDTKGALPYHPHKSTILERR